MKLTIASQNEHKIAEIKAKLPQITISGLDSKIFTEELEETSDTLEGNALQKARQVFAKTGSDCFADDTGLEVTALDGEPGVFSARYAGSQKSSEDNMELLLDKLAICRDRSAQFRTVIALILNGEEQLFEGICHGQITAERTGSKGFGYDPIFIPNGSDKTFAEMTMEEKGVFSHRAKAIEKLVNYINK